MFWFEPWQNQLLVNCKVDERYWKLEDATDIYWARSLMQKLESCLVFDIPENWSKDFFKWCLWSFGYVACFKTERFGLTFNPATVSGYDFYYQPTKCLVTNPLMQKEFIIHKNAELIKLTPDFIGILDIIVFYAKKLSNFSKGIDVGSINTKLPMILSAHNPSQNATLRYVYDLMQKMEPLIIYDSETSDEIIPSKDPFSAWTQDFKQTYIVTELLENLNSVLDDFYTEIGLPVTLDKKSHILDSEANFQQLQSQARLSCWLNCLNDSFSKVNKLFGTNMSVSEKLEEEGGSYDEFN